MSAKDKGTGKEANVTITASTKLSDDEINQAVKDAEKFAEEDKNKKETIEVKNNAEQMVYQTEKTIKDLGDKISEEDKSNIEEKVKAVNTIKDGEDLEAIKKATEELTEVLYGVSSKVYAANAEAQGQGAEGEHSNTDGEANHDDNVVDADFKEEDDKK